MSRLLRVLQVTCFYIMIYRYMLRISIVIPTKNEEKLLPRLFKSITAQTLQNIEVIIADAGSTDRTCDIAKEFGAHVIKGGMPGPGRNAGAKIAKADYIIFLDADVVLTSPKFLSDSIHEMEKKQIDVATCKVRALSRKPVDKILHDAYNAYALATEKVRPHAPGGCIFVRRSVHVAVNGFDEKIVFAEDMDYVQRIVAAGYRFRILRSHAVATSVRRLEKDGRLAIALKFIFAEMKMITSGSFTEAPFEYVMGGDAAKTKEDDETI